MPGKRSRLNQSQSFSDVGSTSNRPSPWEAGFPVDNITDQSLQRILVASPPTPQLPEKENDVGGGLVENEHFLERCDHCRKRLNKKQDVYMYGYLGAFCSPECRDAQIAIDKAGSEVHGQSIGTRMSGSRMTTTGNQRQNHRLYITS